MVFPALSLWMTYCNGKGSKGGFSGCIHVDRVCLNLEGNEPEKLLNTLIHHSAFPSRTTAFLLWENSLQPLRSASPSIDYYPDSIIALDCVLKSCTGIRTEHSWTRVALGNMELMSIVSKPIIYSIPCSGSTCLLVCLMVTLSKPVICSSVLDSTVILMPSVIPRKTSTTPNNLGARGTPTT